MVRFKEGYNTLRSGGDHLVIRNAKVVAQRITGRNKWQPSQEVVKTPLPLSFRLQLRGDRSSNGLTPSSQRLIGSPAGRA